MVADDPRYAKGKKRLAVLGTAALLACVAGGFTNATAVLRAYLVAWMFWIGLAVGAIGILMLHHLVGGRWGRTIRPYLESAAQTIPWLGVLFLPCLIGLKRIFPWAAPSALQDPHIAQIHLYLNPAFFVVRAVFYFVLWSGLAWLRLRGRATPGAQIHPARRAARLGRVSGPGLVVLVLTGCFAATDWGMSLEPHWSSTIYGLMFLTGAGLSAFAGAVIVIAVFRDARDETSADALHDLGKLLFAFVILWIYMAFSQFLIIWAGNLKSEIPWYVHRTRGGWQVLAILLLALQFGLPFLLLLSREVKRRVAWLTGTAVVIMAMRWVDVFWLLNPAFYPERFHASVWDLLAMAGLGGVWLALFLRYVERTPASSATRPKEMAA